MPGIEEGGRLWVKGPNVMLGYLRFEKPGVIEPPEGGWYDTGDIVKVDDEGFITILGRAKRFAKIGGEMVSLAAVESVVAEAFPGQHHALVAAPDARKGERLVLVTDASGLDRAKISDALRKRGMSELNLPAEVIQVDAVPLLGTGKTDYPAVQKMLAERQPGAKATADA